MRGNCGESATKRWFHQRCLHLRDNANERGLAQTATSTPRQVHAPSEAEHVCRNHCARLCCQKDIDGEWSFKMKVSLPVCSPLSFLKVMRTSINSTLNVSSTHEMATATVAAVNGGKAIPAFPPQTRSARSGIAANLSSWSGGR